MSMSSGTLFRQSGIGHKWLVILCAPPTNILHMAYGRTHGCRRRIRRKMGGKYVSHHNWTLTPRFLLKKSSIRWEWVKDLFQFIYHCQVQFCYPSQFVFFTKWIFQALLLLSLDNVSSMTNTPLCHGYQYAVLIDLSISHITYCSNIPEGKQP